VKQDQKVRMPVIFKDVLGEKVEMSVEVGITENTVLEKEDGGGGRVLLGMDWWAGRKLRLVWAGEDDSGFVGFMIGERRVGCAVMNV